MVVIAHLADVGATNYTKDISFGKGKTHEFAQKWQAKFKEITNNGGNGQEMYELREELGS